MLFQVAIVDVFEVVLLCRTLEGRLRNVCVPCPNTAWLLFLIFALALIALVAISVYLSKKRLNLAILGIGVVRALVLSQMLHHPSITL